MNYQKLAELYESLSSTTKRLEKTEILGKFLKQLPEKDKDVMYLLLGDIYPEYDDNKRILSLFFIFYFSFFVCSSHK